MRNEKTDKEHIASRKVTCQRCNKPFSCGAKNQSCWCSKIALSKDTLAALRAQYKDCLCAPCLEDIKATS